MQPRYFIGITLPQDISDKISTAQKDLLGSAKVMEPLVPHITLLHPNILMSLAPLYFVPRAKEVAARRLPITVKLAKTAMFDDRVLHIAVTSPELLELQRELVALLPDHIRARYEVGRDFTPHVTVVQAKPLQKLDTELVAGFKERLDPLLPKTFSAENLTQFTWQRPRTYRLSPI